MDPLMFSGDRDAVDSVPELAANHRDVGRLDLAAGNGRGDHCAGTGPELVTGMERHERYTMRHCAHGSHLVEARSIPAIAGQDGYVDVLLHGARLVGFDPAAWPTVRIVARHDVVPVANQPLPKGAGDAWR